MKGIMEELKVEVSILCSPVKTENEVIIISEESCDPSMQMISSAVDGNGTRPTPSSSLCFICNQPALVSSAEESASTTTTETILLTVAPRLFNLRSGQEKDLFPSSAEFYCSECIRLLEGIDLIYKELDKLNESLNQSRKILETKLHRCYEENLKVISWSGMTMTCPEGQEQDQSNITDIKGRIQRQKSIFKKLAVIKMREQAETGDNDVLERSINESSKSSSVEHEIDRTLREEQNYSIPYLDFDELIAHQPIVKLSRMVILDSFLRGYSSSSSSASAPPPPPPQSKQEKMWSNPNPSRTNNLPKPNTKLPPLVSYRISSFKQPSYNNKFGKQPIQSRPQPQIDSFSTDLSSSRLRENRKRNYSQLLNSFDDLPDDNRNSDNHISNDDDDDRFTIQLDTSSSDDGSVGEEEELKPRPKPKLKLKPLTISRKPAPSFKSHHQTQQLQRIQKSPSAAAATRPDLFRFRSLAAQKQKPRPLALLPTRFQDKLFTCPLEDCRNMYASPGGLRKHMRTQHKSSYGQFLSKTKSCGSSSSSILRASYDPSKKPKLPRHASINVLEVKIFKCDTCGKVVKSNYDLKCHQETHKPDGERRHVCKECGKGFFKNSMYRKHVRSHELDGGEGADDGPSGSSKSGSGRSGGGGRTVCEICGLAVVEIRAHMRRHSGEKRHKCTYCEKSFGTKSSAQTHMRIHTGEKPFHCDRCGLRFRSSQCYKRHLKVHSEEKPHVCDFCGKAFRSRQNLNEHRHIHTKELPHRCNICGKRFPDREQFTSHMNDDHTAEQIERKRQAISMRSHIRSSSSSSVAHHEVHDPLTLESGSGSRDARIAGGTEYAAMMIEHEYKY